MDSSAILCFVSGLCLSVIQWSQVRLFPRMLCIVVGFALLLVVIDHPHDALDYITTTLLQWNKAFVLFANHFATDVWPACKSRGQYFVYGFACGKSISFVMRVSLKVLLLMLATGAITTLLWLIGSLLVHIQTVTKTGLLHDVAQHIVVHMQFVWEAVHPLLYNMYVEGSFNGNIDNAQNKEEL